MSAMMQQFDGSMSYGERYSIEWDENSRILMYRRSSKNADDKDVILPPPVPIFAREAKEFRLFHDASGLRYAGLPVGIEYLSNLELIEASHSPGLDNGGAVLPLTLPHSLVSLNLSHCCLKSIPDFVLPNLRELDLSHNELEEWPRCVTGLSSSATPTSSSPESSSASVSQPSVLRKLNLSNNRLELSDSLSFEHFAELIVLKLDHNNISRLPESLSCVSKLRALSLGHNPIMELPVDFHKLAHMVELNVSNTNFARMPNLPSSLKRLDVSYCGSMRSFDWQWRPRNMELLLLNNCESLVFDVNFLCWFSYIPSNCCIRMSNTVVDLNVVAKPYFVHMQSRLSKVIGDKRSDADSANDDDDSSVCPITFRSFSEENSMTLCKCEHRYSVEGAQWLVSACENDMLCLVNQCEEVIVINEVEHALKSKFGDTMPELPPFLRFDNNRRPLNVLENEFVVLPFVPLEGASGASSGDGALRLMSSFVCGKCGDGFAELDPYKEHSRQCRTEDSDNTKNRKRKLKVDKVDKVEKVKKSKNKKDDEDDDDEEQEEEDDNDRKEANDDDDDDDDDNDGSAEDDGESDASEDRITKKAKKSPKSPPKKKVGADKQLIDNMEWPLTYSRRSRRATTQAQARKENTPKRQTKQKKNNSGRMSCAQCDSSLGSVTAFRNHMRACKKVAEAARKLLPFVCERCDASFKVPSEFVAHAVKCFKNQESQGVARKFVRRGGSLKMEKGLSCRFCGKQYGRSTFHKRHERKCSHRFDKKSTFSQTDEESSDDDDHSSDSSSSDSSSSDSSSDDDEPVSCGACKDVKRVSRNELVRHIYDKHSHLKNTFIPCFYCNKNYRTKHGYTGHLKTCVGDASKCLYCDRRFVRLDYLVPHIAKCVRGIYDGSMVMQGSGRALSSLVGSSASNNNDKKRKHTEEEDVKPNKRGKRPLVHECLKCGRWYAQKFHFRNHVKKCDGT